MGRPWPTHVMMIAVVLELVCFIPIMVYSSSSSYRVYSDGNTEELSGFRVNMRHIDDHESSLIKRSQSAVERSKRRAGSIAEVVRQKQLEAIGNVKAADELQTPVHVGNGEFLIEVGYGSPGELSQGILATGSDLIWTQCQPCTKCYEQSVPIYDPNKSSTFSKVGCTDAFCTNALGPWQPDCSSSKDCQYEFSYDAGGTSTKGYLIYDTLTLGKDTKVSNVSFGCSTENTVTPIFTDKVSGVVGMGRGPLSLVSQLGSKVGKRFSHCFLSYDKYFGGADKTSPLLFGQLAKLSGEGKVQTISFIKNDQMAFFYYVPLTGITVGGKVVSIPAGTFDVKNDGSGGVIIDSGTSLTQLAEAAYTPLADAMKSGISQEPVDGSSVGLDLCYAVKAGSGSLEVPSLAFNFEGGVTYEFPTENYFRQASDELFCLAIIPLPSDRNSSPSILGNIAQQNFHVLYDVDANTLSFQPAACDSL